MYQFFSLLIYATLVRCAYGQSSEQKHYHVASPHEMGLKPSNSLDDVPLIDLIEPAPSIDDPRLAELNSTALRLKLGANFDPAVMSISPPNEKNEGGGGGGSSSYFGFRRNRRGRLIPTGTIPDFLSQIDFKYLTLPNGSRVRTKISSKLKRKIQQFLWAYTACPVLYRWKDLGVRFWPRYLKTGYCPQNVSCSVPPGMTCRPSASTHKTLLRWFCKNYTHKHCQWIKVEYPVLTECSCSCASESNNY
ncbi:hypothetical protein V9T40_007581 [Parthenolecanium corni]|uniref:Noggin n=1 Tax=Parthenolecanium corni TaxID=536013 RepID=A0AAN9TXV1_9HEMI